MTEMTTKQIAAQLQRSDLTAAVCQELVRAIAARRRTIQERLTSIEDRNGAGRRAVIASADPGALAKLNQEAEALDDELGFLADLDTRAFRLHLAAVEREVIESGARAHRRIAQVLGNAEQALTAYLAARQQLDDATGSIGGANEQQRWRIAALGEDRAQGERLVVDDATLDRILAVMHPPALVREEQQRGARAFLRSRICVPAPVQYGDPPPDLREQVNVNMFARRDS